MLKLIKENIEEVGADRSSINKVTEFLLMGTHVLIGAVSLNEARNGRNLLMAANGASISAACFFASRACRTRFDAREANITKAIQCIAVGACLLSLKLCSDLVSISTNSSFTPRM